MDQTIEETINKDTQMPGGTKGVSTKKGAVFNYYITADYRATCVRQLRYMVNSQRKGVRHPSVRGITKLSGYPRSNVKTRLEQSNLFLASGRFPLQNAIYDNAIRFDYVQIRLCPELPKMRSV